jgi:transposase
MGRSRGGLTSKIHALVDADGRAIALRLTGGQVHDSQEAKGLREAMPEGATLLRDKGYDSKAIREAAAFNRIKRRCGVATRYDKDPANYLAAVTLICTRI